MNAAILQRRLLQLALALALLALAAWAPAAQACSSGGCVMAGPRLASVNSGRGALMNALLGRLTNSSITVNVGDWNGIATGNISLLKVANALQTQLGVSSPTQALNAPITLAQLATATATAATAEGSNLLAANLAGAALGLANPSGTFKLGDLITTTNGISDTRINALELISGAAQLYNTKNVLTTPQAVTLSGADLGLGALLGQVKLSAQVVEPPVYVCGPTSTAFHSATVRIKLDIDLIDISLDTTSLLSVLGVASATVKLADLSLYIEVARADGTIGLLDTVNNALQVNVAPGVADLYIGTMADDAVFFNRGRKVLDSDFSNATIGSVKMTFLSIPVADVSIYARGVAHGQQPSSTLLQFNGPYPQTKTAYTQAGFATTLLNTLVSNLTITLSGPVGGLLDGVLQPLIKTIIRTGLLTNLSTLLSNLIDPLLETLGIRLGEVDVTAGGAVYSCQVSGSVYNDINHSSARDGNENGVGIATYVKLVTSGAPTGPAVQMLTVDPATGAFSFTGVPVGSYTLVVNTANTLADVSAAAPTGWLATEQPTLVRSLTVSNADFVNQRFGLYNGSRISGTVFKDIGNGGGTANNGVRDGAEVGVAGATVKLTDAGGNTLIDSAQSGDQGSYTLWLPNAAMGAVKIAQLASGDWVPVGGQAGTSGGIYTLATDSTAFAATSGSSYTGLNFGKVPVNRFDTDGQQSAMPGRVAFFTHSYTAGTAGTLSFILSAPGTAGWSVLLYDDVACNGQLDVADTVISATRAVVAGQKVCVVAKVSVPQEAAMGAQFPVAITARLAYANHTLVGEQQRQDLTIVGDSDALRLVKTVDKLSAAIGEVITYTITYRNLGAQGLSTLKIIDNTPAYTVLSSASCGSTASGLVCSVSQQPAGGQAGRVEWSFTGTLGSGAEGTVVLRVLLQ